ncbi:endonuclease/exonuclease/phosphatase family protein [Streptomyces antimycoticus]|uniref:endonuclease/exonuclease/phosphatase family protein n=1 Tax=Streptomyces antimycoticus TaxID=68175 RepID=UPI002570E0A8|nr:endonuclease/exonuclease/phosphatase family protein [Streptomyces antimycoticus]WJD96141.1 endonuclease/exonuclease/phosphatase family protein [Streptomyces antimycoticus]
MNHLNTAPGRRRFLAVAAGLGATAAAGTSGVAAAAPGPRRLRVATFNIHHGASPADVLDLERVARVIQDLRVDVVGLQEVDRFWKRSGFVDQPAWLGERLGMRHAFGANLDLDPEEPGRPRRQYGTAVLSREPIRSWTNTHLPLVPGHEQRGLLRATLEVRGGCVDFAVTHLQHDDTMERERQAARIVELLGSSPERTVLVGDLNATPETPELGILTGALDDVWPRAGSGDGFTYDALDPHARIDFHLASRDLRPLTAQVVTADPEASDHLPVVSDLEMPVRRHRR